MIDVPGEDKYHFQPRLFGKVSMFYFYHSLSSSVPLLQSTNAYKVPYCLGRRVFYGALSVSLNLESLNSSP